MAFKNRKKNYPLYETTNFSNLREMTENVADRYPDKIAFSYKKNPMDKVRSVGECAADKVEFFTP